MLLRCIHLHTDGACMVFPEEILNRVEIVLTHITQSATVVIPITAEGPVDPMLIVRLVGCWTEPFFVIKLGGYRFRLQICSSYPEKLPVKSGMSAHGDLKRPTQHAAIYQLFDWFNSRIHAIEIGIKPEPGIQAEDPSMLLHRLDYTLALTYGA